MTISTNGTGIRPGVCTSTTRPSSPYEGMLIYETDTDRLFFWDGSSWVSSEPSSLTVALSDEVSTITTGNSKLTMRAPFSMKLTSLPRASLTTASSSGLPTVDINVNGSSILSTKLTIDANEKTSVTAATPAVLSSTTIADDDELTFDIDVAGTGAKGLKVTIYYRRTT